MCGFGFLKLMQIVILLVMEQNNTHQKTTGGIAFQVQSREGSTCILCWCSLNFAVPYANVILINFCKYVTSIA